uniref:Uncharacterized protein n=1 Tax=Arundo donax TaxID=35708 RepID=A0A0A9BN50_ARUDO
MPLLLQSAPRTLTRHVMISSRPGRFIATR